MKNLFALMIFFLAAASPLMAQNALAKKAAVQINASTALIKWDQTTHEFGEITQNVPAEASFTLTNNSDKPLLLKEVKPTCGCTIADYDQEAILPGASTTITTRYNAKKEGSFHKTIKVLTNLHKEPISLKLKGTVIKARS